jgi:hypothetical protein
VQAVLVLVLDRYLGLLGGEQIRWRVLAVFVLLQVVLLVRGLERMSLLVEGLVRELERVWECWVRYLLIQTYWVVWSVSQSVWYALLGLKW